MQKLRNMREDAQSLFKKQTAQRITVLSWSFRSFLKNYFRFIILYKKGDATLQRHSEKVKSNIWKSL